MKYVKEIAKGVGDCVAGATQCILGTCSCAIKVVAYSVADVAMGGYGISTNANIEAVKDCKEQLSSGFDKFAQGTDIIKNNVKYI